MFVGFEMQHASPRYQIIFLGIMIIVLLYEIFKKKNYGGDKNKLAVMISTFIMLILSFLLVMGKSYNKINNNFELIILLTAFGQFLLVLIVFGYRIVIKSGDSKRIRQFLTGIILLVILALVSAGVFIFFGKYL